MLPGAPTNPFQGAFLQARNYLYWRLLLDTGGRRDEVRSVKVADIDYSTRRLKIRVSKTMPRTVPIVHQTAEFFDSFINEHWAHLPRESRRQGYLFTNKEGQHLSLRSCNRIFESLRKQVIDIPDFLTPHTVRRAWNDAFSESVDALPAESRPNEKAEAAMRSKLQGWSENSTMADRYAKRTIRRKADEIAETLMSDIKPKKEK
jgi:integrase